LSSAGNNSLKPKVSLFRQIKRKADGAYFMEFTVKSGVIKTKSPFFVGFLNIRATKEGLRKISAGRRFALFW